MFADLKLSVQISNLKKVLKGILDYNQEVRATTCRAFTGKRLTSCLGQQTGNTPVAALAPAAAAGSDRRRGLRTTISSFSVGLSRPVLPGELRQLLCSSSPVFIFIRARVSLQVLGLHISDFTLPDVSLLGEHADAAELGRMLQLILGCAVNCEQKQGVCVCVCVCVSVCLSVCLSVCPRAPHLDQSGVRGQGICCAGV